MPEPANDDRFRIAVFIDGSFWFHLHYYWLHHHRMRVRLALDGVMDAARWYAHQQHDRSLGKVVIDQIHFFQGVRGGLPPRFAAVLDSMGAIRHDLPVDPRRDRAVGVAVEMALTCWIDASDAEMVMLIVGSDDLRPLVERLVEDEALVLIPQIQAQFTDGRFGKPQWLVTSPHLCEAATDTPTWEDLVSTAEDAGHGLTSPFLRVNSRTPVRTPAWR